MKFPIFPHSVWINFRMERLIFWLSILNPLLALHTTVPCQQETVPDGYICRCTDDHCDTLDIPEPDNNEYIAVMSSKSGERFSYEKGKIQRNSDNFTVCDPKLLIDQSKLHQQHIGFGGAFTGAVTNVLKRLPPKLRDCFYRSYFASEHGIGYNMLRISIGGSDFDTELWFYNATIFQKLDERDLERNAQIKYLMEYTNKTELKILGVAFYAPPWMRQANEWNGFVNNQLEPKYYQIWADYHAHWLQLMKMDNISIWGISTANQPVYSQIKSVPCMSWNASDHSRYIVDYLMPTLKRSGHTNITIHAFDDMRPLIVDWMNGLHAANPKSVEYLDFVDVHAYFDLLLPKTVSFLDLIQRKYQKPILYSEMSFGVIGVRNIILGSWDRAEQAIDILMQNMKYGIVGYIDWNLMLNSSGGPTFTATPIDACILADEDFQSFVKQPTFYVLAHFGKFILPGSRRIDAFLFGIEFDTLDSLAYLRPDKTIVILLYNKCNVTVDKLIVLDRLNNVIEIEVKPKTLYTIVYRQFDEGNNKERS